MLCCLIAAFLLGPLGLWVRARPAGPDCCADNRRMLQATSVIVLGVAILCLAMFMLAWFQPVPFRHICSVLSPV